MSINLKNISIIFMATPQFSVPILNALIENYNLVAVVTQPDKKVGRKQILTASPIKQLALENKVQVLQPKSVTGNAEFIRRLTELKPDLIVVAAYGFILPKELLDIPQYGVINVHASLLPKYRGASPIQAAILNCDKTTGVVIMLMDEKMDHGPILAQQKAEIEEAETFKTLHDKLSILGTHLLIDTLAKWINKEIKPKEQNHDQATYCKLITKEDGKINWHKSASEIERQVRALNPWPSTWTSWNNKNIKSLVVEILNPAVGCAESDIGKTFLTEQKQLAINCKTVSLLLKKLKLEAKKPMTDQEFFNGYPDIVGKVLQ